MANSMKKTVSVFLLLALMLVMAVPAFAASQSYEFYYNDSYHAHSSAFIVGDAEVNGNTVTITLQDDYYPYLLADNGTGTKVLATKGTDANGNTTFTFNNSNPSEDIPVTLYVSVTYPGGSHEAAYNLDIHWK